MYVALNVATAPSVAWEALKVVVRDFVIQYASYMKRKGPRGTGKQKFKLRSWKWIRKDALMKMGSEN